ncbi:TetR/AcrR family transcriptional regulator [Shouchella clausii]|jgi:AcrR family transcriptional regulator|uniref:TetR/AcrR family transcriptional regulator n=1 Tax=Shouchella clausii TaxID=79880 RepID=UPI000BA7C761|nr:TetR/AcrR family transcriptional regulator [Shouchella clausii]SPU21498.1 TetR family transcriptional regulator [Niallia circulans]MCM3551059.1 TetR/AcrR family transcriptional regulator [Shouchella clausii]MEB5478337.1 TetR/AcrR family transcriptional regulator [Shouchella clausii]PAD15054.1 hypothetical protein CHH74_07320 [Shouchella clausii]PAD94295.1 hypothetical protein CHH52_00710 [Shouchella clausii]
MNEKKTTIIETAIHLFAKKGYFSTSIQEIASEAGISKGAFYLHFESKDKLLIDIYRYYYEKMSTLLDRIEQKKLTPRKAFQTQIEFLFAEVSKHKEFIIMHFQEQVLPISHEVRQFVYEKKLEHYNWQKRSLLSIYGQEAERYIPDLILLFEGLSHSLFKLLLLTKHPLSPKKTATYLLRRLDNLAEGLVAEGKEPFVSEQRLQQLDWPCSGSTEEQVKQTLSAIRKRLPTLHIPEEKKQEVLDALSVLQAEMGKKEPKKIIFQGMLATMATVKELRELCNCAANLLDIH